MRECECFDQKMLQLKMQSENTLFKFSSSSDITRERFLSKDWQTQDIHQLIGTLKSDRKKDNKKQQSELRDYIEKLLR